MTRPNASRYRVSSFGPELLAVLVKGAAERVEIPCPSMRVMMALQMRLQMLRGAMGRENHPQYELVTKARTSRTWDPSSPRSDPKNCILVVQPNDHQFADILDAAGIKVTEHTADLLAETTPDTPSDPSLAPSVAPPPNDPYWKFK